MIEEWKDITGFEGIYQVSNLGRVKSLNYKRSGREQYLTYCKNSRGYLRVRLCNKADAKHYSVHRLVANAFIPNPNNLPEVNHKDENKEHNCVENLEWCNRKYNINYGSSIKRRSKKIMCVETGVVYPSSIEAARQTGVNQGNIISCCKVNLKVTKGFHWKYTE